MTNISDDIYFKNIRNAKFFKEMEYDKMDLKYFDKKFVNEYDVKKLLKYNVYAFVKNPYYVEPNANKLFKILYIDEKSINIKNKYEKYLYKCKKEILKIV